MHSDRKLLLMLDYDGTLVPIRRHPKLATLSRYRKSFLRALSRKAGIKLAIISGRKLSVVKKMVGIRNIIYVGNHGFEIEAGSRRWIQPAAKRTLPVLKKIKKSLRLVVTHFRGTFVEDKSLTLSIHFRQLAESSVPFFTREISRDLKAWGRKINITHGKKVVEVRPLVDWDKGKAVKWLISKFKFNSYFPIYIGDDTTDEDAFRALRCWGETIFVGRGKTSAKKRLKNIADVYRYLRGFTQ